MKTSLVVLVVLWSCVASRSQSIPQLLNQKEACRKFIPAVVRVDFADGNASGFIVSADGWIVTAGHVVIDENTGEQRHSISVRLSNGTIQFAKIFIDRESAIRDFALLKVEASGLPFLELADASEVVESGTELTLIGYPFSAESSYAPSISAKFCLTTIVTATDAISNLGVNVDAVYFQGPGIKGLSGGPLISRETGHVIGIQSQKLAGIGRELSEVRKQIIEFRERIAAAGVRIKTTQGGTNPTEDILALINVLDRHLANGLGVATGANDAKRFLTVTRRKYDKEQQHTR